MSHAGKRTEINKEYEDKLEAKRIVQFARQIA